ncbi:MAG: ABC transporter permease subunit [Chitinivibrionales bacterium]|nr:ABC transporter permease subunit [Chitinivibrionales bacterium]
MFKYILVNELRALLYTWKSMVWFLITSVIFSFASYLFLTDKELSLLDQSEMLWLLSKVIIGTALMIITVDASSTITGEFEKETAESLFLTPLSLKDFVLGKLLASLSLWIAIFLIAVPYIIVVSAGSHVTAAFIMFVLMLGTMLILGFQMMIFGISFLFRSSKNTLTTSLVILLALVLPATFSSTLKNNPLSHFLSVTNPIDNVFSSLDNVLVDYQTTLTGNLKYVFPVLIFCFAAFAFMLYSTKLFKRSGVVKND